MYIPNYTGLRKIVMEEIYSTPYLGHLGVTKMIFDLRAIYFQLGLKCNLIAFVA